MSSSAPPLFSIVTAVWNRAATIGPAAGSLTGQSCQDYEHVVQDAGSTDGTLAALAAHADPRMKLVSVPDLGIYDGLNRALARCSGQIIGLLHSDDFYAHPRVLEHVANRFAQSDADAVYGDLDYVAAADPARIVRRWRAGAFTAAALRRGWMPPHPALFINRSVIEQWGNYDTSYRIAADYDAVLRYFGTGQINAAYLPEVLVKMRLGGASNRSLARIIQKSCEDHRALRSNRVGGIGTLLYKNVRKLPQFFG